MAAKSYKDDEYLSEAYVALVEAVSLLPSDCENQRAWIYRFISNRLIDFYRKERLRKHSSLLEADILQPGDTEKKEAFELIKAACKDQETYDMVQLILEGRSIREIARHWKVPRYILLKKYERFKYQLFLNRAEDAVQT